MSKMTTAAQLEHDVHDLSRQLAALSEEVVRLERVARELRAAGVGPEPVSPSVPLDAADPSALITYSDEAYDALVERLEATPQPNERLRRTMAGHLDSAA